VPVDGPVVVPVRTMTRGRLITFSRFNHVVRIAWTAATYGASTVTKRTCACDSDRR
jgi:hypothetical protein